MAIIKRLGVITAAAALCLALVTPALAASDMTVGDFVKRMALARGLAGTDARVASDALRGVGVRVPTDMNFSNRLTEGDVAVIARAAGLNVRTSNPQNMFTTEQTEMFFINFRGTLGEPENTLKSDTNPGQGTGPGNGNGGPPFDPFTKGKHGKGKGKGSHTPTDPE